MKVRTSAFFVLILFLLCSCSQVKEEKAFSTYLSEVDSYIISGSTVSALELLKEIAPKSASPLEKLGVYRRFIQLGSAKDGLKVIEKLSKAYPDNIDITAIYAWHLFKNGNEKKALKVAEKLKGTKNASLYSQMILTVTPQDKLDLLSPDLESVYAGAYLTTHNDLWLQNAALVAVMDGDFQRAVSYGDISNCTNPLFWGYVAYDGKKYNTALEFLNRQQSISDVESLILMNDALEILGDKERGETLRSYIVSSFPDNLPCEVLLNKAKDFRDAQNYIGEFQYLQKALLLYPDNVKVWDAYIKLAITLDNLPKENHLATALRQTDLRSAQMAAYDKLPQITLNSVLADLERVAANNDPDLSALHYAYKTEPDFSQDMTRESKLASLWLLLESYGVPLSTDTELLVQVAASRLLEFDLRSDARRIFDGSLESRFGSMDYEKIYENLSPKDLELAAYFAASGLGKEVNLPLSYFLYTKLFEKNTGFFSDLAVATGYQGNIPAMINMAELLAGKRKFYDAWDMYAEAVNLTENAELKADILYRLTTLQIQTGFLEEAHKSLSYCLEMDPYHQKALLLQKSIPPIQ